MAAKYERLKVIGRGTFGLAWLTKSRTSQRLYVVKEIHLVGMTEKDRNQAVNEVAILAGLKHANVVRYREAFVDESRLHIAMEYADGGDLSEMIQTNQRTGEHISEGRIMDWFVQICFALRYIHAKKILHRDLKPQNIFVTSQGIIKVGDFGIARMLHDTKDHAHTAIGTPYYMSPEICGRNPYNQKSDMWAAGCVLYEMTSLVHPFEACDFSSLVMMILRGRYKAIPRHYGPLMEDLISVLLRVDPERRPTADQLLSIPGIQGHVLAYTNRCKNQSSSPLKTMDKETWDSDTPCGSPRNGSSMHQKLWDSTAITRRHSVASVTGRQPVGGNLLCSQSECKHRRQSVGVRVADGENTRAEKMVETNSSQKSSIDGDGKLRSNCSKYVLGTYRQHRVASTGRIPENKRLWAGNAESSAGESAGLGALKRRSFSVSVVDRASAGKYKRGIMAARVPAMAKASSINTEGSRTDCTYRKTAKHTKSCLDNPRKRNADIVDLFNVECNGDIATTKRSLKKSTYILESPSTAGLGIQGADKRLDIIKDALQVPKTSSEATRAASKSENCCRVALANLDDGATDGHEPEPVDNLDQWEMHDFGENALWNTVIERKTPVQDEQSGCDVNHIPGHNSSKVVVTEIKSLKDGAGGCVSSDMNNCLFRCRIRAGDSAREIRGKIETLRIYLEERIGVESSLACLNLVRSASHRKTCSAWPDQGVLSEMERVLGDDKMTCVPVVLHLHNLEQSCDWLSE